MNNVLIFKFLGTQQNSCEIKNKRHIDKKYRNGSWLISGQKRGNRFLPRISTQKFQKNAIEFVESMPIMLLKVEHSIALDGPM